MTKFEKPSILTRKNLLSGIAGIALVVGMGLAPLSSAYAGGNNDNSGMNVSDTAPEAGETNNPAREAAENSMSKLGLNMENSAREIGAAARKVADGVHKDAENKMGDVEKGAREIGEAAHKAAEGVHKDAENKMGDHAKGNSANGSAQADGQPGVDTNAAPMLLADFISSVRKGNPVVSGNGSEANMELRYANGWKEEIDNGRYVLVDPNGNKIITRPVTSADISRMRSALK
ncbi:hypothetical protein MNBD_ALPHA12-2150 [hydrothermal vent metagenome]|uniref:Uncharacterized protein n=1 Tax=hydrothermal vent metagenome TaxID=652676 RepID=A0A3B0TS12_9ZZZZ